ELNIPWLAIGPSEALPFGIRVDPLAAMMLFVVTSVSSLVQVYSWGYMAGDRGFSRYYAFLSLFTFSMLGLVLASNLLTMFIFWEGVGVCSYLLIGHWFERPVDPVAYEQAEVETNRTGIAITPSEAGKKAFVTTRLGDVGFLIGILLLFTLTLRIGEPTLDF